VAKRKLPKQQLKVRFRSPSQVGEEYNVGSEVVCNWIRAGELAAVDVSSPGSPQPRYRIDDAALMEFEESRRVGGSPQPATRRRSKQTAGIREYF
jgi:hypothetical protein